MRKGYYSRKLAGTRLRRCYEIAPARVKRYLKAEIGFLLHRIGRDDAVLELGCGYGRVALELARAAGRVVGIDTAGESLALARELAAGRPKCEFVEMDARNLEFEDGEFDAVVCVQNGICAFGADPVRVVREALRVTRPGGRVLVSTYTESFWPHRLRWFRLQAAQDLVGAIDEEATGEGVIVCRDGFRAGCMSPADLAALAEKAGGEPLITEVDGSSLFCEISAPGEIMTRSRRSPRCGRGAGESSVRWDPGNRAAQPGGVRGESGAGAAAPKQSPGRRRAVGRWKAGPPRARRR